MLNVLHFFIKIGQFLLNQSTLFSSVILFKTLLADLILDFIPLLISDDSIPMILSDDLPISKNSMYLGFFAEP